MRIGLCWLGLLLGGACPEARADGGEPQFNYAEALQKTVYFFEAQQSGKLSPNNRVIWRGPACLNDGQDIGRDLSGGWFDAGDHWTANLTMAFAAMTLAWSAVEHPEGWQQAGQMDELLESLIHVNRYFLKCVLNPDCADPERDLDVAIGCGGREGVEPPNVHAMWAPAELAHLMTNRPTFRVNKACPAGDIPAAMAAAMAASAMVIRDHGSMLRDKRGYDSFDPAFAADLLLDRAEKLTRFAKHNMGPAYDDKASKEEKEQVQRQRLRALRADGKIVEVGYRSGPADKVFTAATWLARAAKTPEQRQRWKTLAEETYEGPYKAESYHDFWKDYGAGNFGKVGAFNMLRLDPSQEKYHAELQLYAHSFTTYKSTPGGLRLREWFAHEYGSLRHANNAAVIALYYSDLVERSPKLSGNTWWKGSKSNAELKTLFFREGKRQVDYALGANPYGRSYLVGFGRQPFNDVHHRGAYGSWAGFEHFISGKADDRGTCRHVLYGALVAGPDHNDVFLCGNARRPWLPLPDGKGHDFFYKFTSRESPVRKEGYVWNAADPPFQDVMDSQFNEVALDYNAGFTASLAFLTAKGLSSGTALPDAEFPPRVKRNDSTDLMTTDREFFVVAKRLPSSAATTELEATVWNRTRWPASVAKQLSFRYYFTLDGDTKPEQVQAAVSGAEKAKLSAVQRHGGKLAFVEVSFPDDAIYPGSLKAAARTVKLRLSAPVWNPDNDWSGVGFNEQPRLLPHVPVYDHGVLVGGEEPPIINSPR